MELAMPAGIAAYSVAMVSYDELHLLTTRLYNARKNAANKVVKIFDPTPNMSTWSDVFKEYDTNWGIYLTQFTAVENAPGAYLKTTKGIFFMDLYNACIFKLQSSKNGVMHVQTATETVINLIHTGLNDTAAEQNNKNLLRTFQIYMILHMILVDTETLANRGQTVHPNFKELVSRLLMNNLLTLQSFETNGFLKADAKTVCDNIESNMSNAMVNLQQNNAVETEQPLLFANKGLFEADDMEALKLKILSSLGMQAWGRIKDVELVFFPSKKAKICRCVGKWAPILDIRYRLVASSS